MSGHTRATAVAEIGDTAKTPVHIRRLDADQTLADDLKLLHVREVFAQTGTDIAAHLDFAAVSALFSVDALLLAGWIHYLAFDLFVGAWEVTDSRREGIHHLLVVPCLIATFMAGPAGLGLYFAIKYINRAMGRQPAAATP